MWVWVLAPVTESPSPICERVFRITGASCIFRLTGAVHLRATAVSAVGNGGAARRVATRMLACPTRKTPRTSEIPPGMLRFNDGRGLTDIINLPRRPGGLSQCHTSDVVVDVRPPLFAVYVVRTGKLDARTRVQGNRCQPLPHETLSFK